MGGSASTEVKPVISFEDAQERVPTEWLETIQLTFQEMSKHTNDLRGRVTREQFREYYDPKALNVLGPIFDRLFEVLDVDGDGSVGYEEFLSGMCIFGKGTKEEKLRFLFKVYDVDRNGSLSIEEFRSLLRGALGGSQAALSALLIAEVSPSSDLVAAMKRNTRESSPHIHVLSEKLFAEADLNKDGQISFPEFCAWAEENLNLNQWMDLFVPSKLEAQLKAIEPSVVIPKELSSKETECLAITSTLFNVATARFVSIDEDGRTLRYQGQGTNLKMTGGYQCGLIHPLRELVIGEVPFYYFEITVIDAGKSGGNAIGFYPANTRLTGVPGWYNNSYGYHADDGCLHYQMKQLQFTEDGHPVTHKWTTGDIVGAGVSATNIFFTLNGQLLRPFFKNVSGTYHPIISFTSPGAVTKVNFGEEPWKYHMNDDLSADSGDEEKPKKKPSKKQTNKDLKRSVAPRLTPYDGVS